MCDFNGPFRLCTCSSDIDYRKPHWILRMNSTNDSEETMVRIGMMMPLNLINKIERTLTAIGIDPIFDSIIGLENGQKRELCCNFEQ